MGISGLRQWIRRSRIFGLFGSIAGLVVSFSCATAVGAADAKLSSSAPMQSGISAPLPSETTIASYFVSEKLDGVRGRWNGQALETRHGNLIAAPSWFTAKFPKGVVLDGELWAGRGRFEWISGLVRSRGREQDWRVVRFMVFDSPLANLVFSERLAVLESIIDKSGSDFLILIPQISFTSVEMVMHHFKHLVSNGAEGLMLHHRQARYIDGRNTLLIKLKPLNDMEGEVIGYKGGQGEFAGVMGALKLRLADGTEFYLGSGFDLIMRRKPPPIGTMVTFQYQGLTKNGKPKGARFLRVRHRE